jgi:hypothetical protein
LKSRTCQSQGYGQSHEESGIRTRGPKILKHKLNIIPKSTAFEISNLGFMAFPAGIYNKIVDGNQTFQQYYPI